MATNTPDFTAMINDMMQNFQMDNTAFQDAFKNQAEFGEKLAKVVLSAAEKSVDLNDKTTKDVLAKVADITTAKEDPAAYAAALQNFASATTEMATESMTAFAEIAKAVQAETLELIMAAAKDGQEEATAAMKKATESMTAAPTTAAAKKK